MTCLPLMEPYNAEEVDDEWVIINCSVEEAYCLQLEFEMKSEKHKWKVCVRKFWRRIVNCIRHFFTKSMNVLKCKN